jgi:ubiquinone/menaquinone biosynthesis C-methylase UbiE
LSLNDPTVVDAEYATERGLSRRIAAYRFAAGPDARQVALGAVAEATPTRVLEVGCGTGELAERIAGELGAEVVALDQSARMVELTRGRGIDARVGDVQELPFADGDR